VCSGNAYRSPVAEALLKKLRPDIKVYSAGTDPAIPISLEAKKYLARESAEQYLKESPKAYLASNLANMTLYWLWNQDTKTLS